MPHHDYHRNVDTFHIPLVDLVSPVVAAPAAFPPPLPTAWFDARCAFFPSHAVPALLRPDAITRHVGNLDKGADFLTGVLLWQEHYALSIRGSTIAAAADTRFSYVGVGKAQALWAGEYDTQGAQHGVMPSSARATRDFLIPANWTPRVRQRMEAFRARFGIDLYTHWLSPQLTLHAWLGVAASASDVEVSYKYKSRTEYDALRDKFDNMLQNLEAAFIDEGAGDEEDDNDAQRLLADLSAQYERETE